MSETLEKQIVDKVKHHFPDCFIYNDTLQVWSKEGKRWLKVGTDLKGEYSSGQVEFSYYWLYTYIGDKDFNNTVEVCCPFEDKSEEESLYLNLTGEYGLFLDRESSWLSLMKF